tara:strand:+ start:205 stop:624 length:420 start_codon:yes stop_codon:yes gene_type:complete
MSESKIPSAAEIFQAEANVVLQEGTYDFQMKKVLENLKRIGKNNSTIAVIFKAVPDKRILEELEGQGYRVRFDTSYDSSKTEKYLTKLRITNPKFEVEGGNFFDKLEDQLKECAFTQGNINLSDETKNIFQSFLNIPSK